jgi:hypothetical protein
LFSEIVLLKFCYKRNFSYLGAIRAGIGGSILRGVTSRATAAFSGEPVI